MSVVGLLLRHWDAPVPLFAAAFGTPYCLIPGYLYARRHGAAWFGVVTAGMTAVTGTVIVLLVTIAYTATVEPWPKPLIWLVGMIFVPIAGILGIFFGRVGAAFVRHPGVSAVG